MVVSVDSATYTANMFVPPCDSEVPQDTTLSEPTTKRRVFCKTCKQIIINVHRHCVEMNVHATITDTSKIVGIPRTSITSILKKGPSKPKKRNNRIPLSKLDDFECDVVRRTVYRLYANKKSPTLDMILKDLQANSDFPYKRTTLRKVLIKLGLKYKTRPAGASEAGTSTPLLTQNISDQESLADDCSDDDDDDDEGTDQDAAETAALKKTKTLSKAIATVTTSSSGAPEKAQQAKQLGNHVGFTCSSCYGAILGFRYSCVECVDFDLCARCEAMREHDHHYMLRVPGPRPEAEFKAMMADIRAALGKRPGLGPEPSQYEVEVKYEPRSDDEDIKPIDPLNVPVDDGSGLCQDLPNVPTRPTGDQQPAPSIVGMIHVPSASHQMLAGYRQPTMIINPLVAETVRTQTQYAAQSKGKVKAATEKRKLTSDQGERVMVPLPFKMPKEEPLHAASGDTGDRRGCASKEADFRVFTMQNQRDDDEEFDSGIS